MALVQGIPQWPSYPTAQLQLLQAEYMTNIIYPNEQLIFKALSYALPHEVKVVILGQDPYPSMYVGLDIYGQQISIPKATGLAFSVPAVIPIEKIPPSLKNIFAEVVQNVYVAPSSGCLEGWAMQGVLLLNTALTVLKNNPGSHLQYWQTYTDSIIKTVSDMNDHVVFMLWGNKAQMKKNWIHQRHTILTAGHPSPQSVQYFTGCGHFTACNNALSQHGQTRIDWSQ